MTATAAAKATAKAAAEAEDHWREDKAAAAVVLRRAGRRESEDDMGREGTGIATRTVQSAHTGRAAAVLTGQTAADRCTVAQKTEDDLIKKRGRGRRRGGCRSRRMAREATSEDRAPPTHG